MCALLNISANEIGRSVRPSCSFNHTPTATLRQGLCHFETYNPVNPGRGTNQHTGLYLDRDVGKPLNK